MMYDLRGPGRSKKVTSLYKNIIFFNIFLFKIKTYKNKIFHQMKCDLNGHKIFYAKLFLAHLLMNLYWLCQFVFSSFDRLWLWLWLPLNRLNVSGSCCCSWLQLPNTGFYLHIHFQILGYAISTNNVLI